MKNLLEYKKGRESWTAVKLLPDFEGRLDFGGREKKQTSKHTATDAVSGFYSGRCHLSLVVGKLTFANIGGFGWIFFLKNKDPEHHESGVFLCECVNPINDLTDVGDTLAGANYRFYYIGIL